MLTPVTYTEIMGCSSVKISLFVALSGIPRTNLQLKEKRMKKNLITILILTLIVGCSKSPDEIRNGLVTDIQNAINSAQMIDADKKLERLRIEFPEYTGTTLLHAQLLEAQMLYHDAMRLYMEAAEANPVSSKLIVAQARIYERLERLDPALRLMEKASKLPQFTNDDHLYYISLLLDGWKLKKAKSQLSVATSSGLDDDLSNLLQLRLDVRVNGSAVSSLANRNDKSSNYYELLADYYESGGWIDSAICYSELSAQADDAGFMGTQTHFLRLLKNGYNFMARQEQDRVASYDPESALIAAMIMRYGWSVGNFTLCSRAAVKYNKLFPNLLAPMIYNIRTSWVGFNMPACEDDINLGQRLVNTGNYSVNYKEFMLDEFELVSHILGIHPGIGMKAPDRAGFQRNERRFIHDHANMVVNWADTNTFDSLGNLALKDHSDDPVWVSGFGDALPRNKSGLERASKYWQSSLEINKNYYPALTSWINNLETGRLYEKALAILSKHSELVNSYEPLLIRQAILNLRTNLNKETIEQFFLSTLHNRGSIESYRTAAAIVDRKGDRALTELFATKLIELNQTLPGLYQIASSIWSELADHETARKIAGAGLKIDKNHAGLLALEARSIYAGGDVEKGIQVFEDIIKKNNGSPDAELLYSKSLAETGGVDGRRAQNHARRAVFLSRSTEQSLVNLSYVNFRFGDYKLSRGDARRTIGTYPESAEAHYYIGASNFEIDRKNVKIFLDKAIELGLRGDKLEHARNILSQL